MLPAFLPELKGPFYRQRGVILCWHCDSAFTNKYWYCRHCAPHKALAPDATRADLVDQTGG